MNADKALQAWSEAYREYIKVGHDELTTEKQAAARDTVVATMKEYFLATACPHPPARLFSWHAYDDTLCVCCNDCGALLKGGVE